MITMDENIKSVHDLVLKDRHMRIKIIIENTGLSYYTVHNISQPKAKNYLKTFWVSINKNGNSSVSNNMTYNNVS